MSPHHLVPKGKDAVLWQMAHKRTSFKSHATSYLLVNKFFLSALWYFAGSRSVESMQVSSLPGLDYMGDRANFSLHSSMFFNVHMALNANTSY